MIRRAMVAASLCLVLAGCAEDSMFGNSNGASDGSIPSGRTYEQARAIFWRHLYPRDGQTLYCAKPFQTDQRQGVNVEHVFPMSWVTNALRCGKRKQCRANSAVFNLIEADLHNLYPARSDVNHDRGAFRFGEISGESRRYGKHCDFEVDRRARVVEPAPAARGDIARAMFYMAHQYQEHGLVIFKKQAQMLQTWHKADPPSATERRRNDLIEKLQGNRNPFVDDPLQLNQLVADGAFY